MGQPTQPTTPVGQAFADRSQRRSRRPLSPRRRGEAGYNLVMLIVAITILNVFAAVALPLWSYTIRREREEETIFRGLQYAEAIRVFRQRNGRFPTALDELVKVEPRSIRQLWTEPLSEDGEFGLVVEAPQQPPQPGQPGQPAAPGTPGAAPTPPGQPVTLPNRPGGGTSVGGIGIGGGTGANLIKLPRAAKDETGNTVGKLTTDVPLAIHGVYLDKQGESLRKFFGKDKYEEWTFTVELVTAPVTAPDRPLPRVTDEWLGKSYPEGLTPVQGGGPGGGFGVGGQAPGQTGQPGQQPGQPTAPGIPAGQGPDGEASEEPVAEPDTPTEFPEDFPDEEQPDEDVHEEEPPPDEPPEEDLPEPDSSDD